MELRTVELFAGIGGFRIAADRVGLRTVWANDLDPHAAVVYRDRFGDECFVEGDVAERLDEVPPHDVLTAGFPCQPFSSAGKKRGVRDPRGTLFSRVVEVVESRRPRFFVLENVKRLLTMERGSHFATILASLAAAGYHVEWRLLNAAHFGLPQNRQRVFLVGSRDDERVRLGELGDDDPTSHDWTPITEHGRRFPWWGLACAERFRGSNPETFDAARDRVTLESILEPEVDEAFDFTDSTLERLGRSDRVERFVDGVEILSNQGGGARMGYTVFGTAGLAPTLTATTSRHYERYRIGDRYRRLTNVEYARLQGFSDDHCAAVPRHVQYRLLGNAVPPPMAEWVLGRLGLEDDL